MKKIFKFINIKSIHARKKPSLFKEYMFKNKFWPFTNFLGSQSSKIAINLVTKLFFLKIIF